MLIIGSVLGHFKGKNHSQLEIVVGKMGGTGDIPIVKAIPGFIVPGVFDPA
jgi:hypothetical protein